MFWWSLVVFIKVWIKITIVHINQYLPEVFSIKKLPRCFEVYYIVKLCLYFCKSCEFYFRLLHYHPLAPLRETQTRAVAFSNWAKRANFASTTTSTALTHLPWTNTNTARTTTNADTSLTSSAWPLLVSSSGTDRCTAPKPSLCPRWD